MRAQLGQSQIVLGFGLLDVPGSTATAEAADSSPVGRRLGVEEVVEAVDGLMAG